MKLCVVVITYFPKIQDTVNNIYQYIEHIDHLIIWENTPIDERDKYKIVIPKYSNKISYMGVERNMGIAYPINKSIKWARQNGYTHIMTMDQDSEWADFISYKKEIGICEENNIAAYVPTIHNIYTGRTQSQENQPIITSGTIHPISIFKHIGLFREDYFIDCIDTEFYYRSIVNNYKVKAITHGILKQKFGDTKQISIFGFYTSGYTAFRRYHICRNNIWMWKEYRDHNILPKNFFFQEIILNIILKQTIKIALWESDKLNKIFSLYKGLYCGFVK